MTDEQRQRILVLCTMSGMGKGGVPVFNEQISTALAARGHDVTLLTVDPVNEGHEGIALHTVRPPEGDVEGRIWLEQQCATLNPTTFGLPDPNQQPFDLIVGHSRFSGPAAVAIRDNWYTEARVAHFLHTSPERLPYVKYSNNLEKAQNKAARDSGIERAVMSRADVVVGVGPLLTEEAKRLAASNQQVPSSHELVPGTKIEPLVQRAQQHDGPLQLLGLGRADDELKGFRDAARAVRLLNDKGVAVHFTVRGVPPDDVPKLQQELSQLSGGNVTVLPFSTDKGAIRNDIRQADALIMPSKHEGFGLVATEALGHGVPVLVNEDSGAARFLRDANRIPPEMGAPCVVPEPANPTHRIKAWANSIEQLKEQLPQRTEDAARLREVLKSYSWEHAATSLAQASATAPAPATDPSAAQSARATVQGPQGTVTLTSGPQEQQPTQQGTTTTQTQTQTQTTTQTTTTQNPIAKAAALTSRSGSTTSPTQGAGNTTSNPVAPARPQVPQPPKPQGPSR
ncbi:glycosyltransferase family 4 protein [Streptomyces sp. NPDC052051]|uniref:glycosyltransferase family 4 protein n=1 Tax=Streptomyces sp. NPDC052051 TaxID=3154649 RepID=UPI00342AD118